MVALPALCRRGTLFLALASCTLLSGVEAVSTYDRAVDYLDKGVKLVKRAATDPVLFRYSLLRYAFFVNIEVGSREDSVNVRLTDQPWLWVGSEKPENCSREESRFNYLQCVYVDWSGIYSPNRSSTFRNVSNARLSLTQSDNTRFTRGYYGTDTVKFGDSTLENVYIGIADNFTQAPEMGIGVYDSDRQTYPSFMESLLASREVTSLSHGLYFNWLERNESYLTFGSVDTAKYDGNLVTFDAPNNTEITVVELISAAFGSPGAMEELNPIQNLKANVEFSTSRMSLPDNVIPGIVRQLGAEYDDDWGGYLVDCDMRNSDLVFEFRFETVNINVSPNHYILPAYGIQGYRYPFKGRNGCSLQVNPMSKYSIATDLGYEAVLGTPFARHTYLVHDYGNRQLSFAPAKFNVTESNVVMLDSRGVAPLFSELPSPTDPSGPVTDPPSPSPTGGPGKTTNAGAIAGGVVGGLAGVAGISLFAFFMMKRKRRPLMNDPVLPPPPMMHNPLPQPPGSQGGYSHVPVFDPNKGWGSRPVSELGTGQYDWNAQGQGAAGHSQFTPYQENQAVQQYSEAPGNQAFAQELPTMHQR